MDVALLVNPAARGGAHTHAASRAAARLRAHGIRVAVVSGGSAGESARLLQVALDAGSDAVLVAGGDGTANLAVQALAGTGIPLGVVPTGTGNDFAHALGLAGLDAEAAADAVVGGAIREIDLARAVRPDGASRLFATVLASGFDSRVNDRANRMRWPRGRARYTLAILVEFARLRGIGYEIDAELADGTRMRLVADLVMATVGNGPRYGGGIPICPDADLTDGLLDLTLVRPAGRLHLLRLLPHVYRGTHTSLPEVETFRVRSVSLTSADVTAYADGDPIGVLPLRIEAVPRALRVFVPAAGPRS